LAYLKLFFFLPLFRLPSSSFFFFFFLTATIMADEIGAPQEDSSKSLSPSATPTIKTETETIVPPLTSSSDCDSAAAAEQRNSPSTTVTSQEYQQQLHEAIMAFDSHGLSQNLMAAMAAAVGVSSPSSTTLQQVPHHPELSNHQGSLPPPPAPPRKDIDFAKRESIRTANRERKKKWRIHNEERSKSKRRQAPTLLVHHSPLSSPL
jgi:hypothetical protein